MTSASSVLKTASSRILALDYLRGFFIIVIIIDHLWRWPNIFELATGRGELWASAAEGFVIISGLLVGYIRGYKNRKKPLAEVSKKLVARGVMLYIWMIVTTVLLVSASWALHFKGNIAYIPIETGHWGELIMSTLRVDYVHTLTHFLYLYAIFLVLSPIVVWLLRRGLAWVVAIISCVVWVYGVAHSIEWMQWQLLFFLPAIAGFYFEPLLDRYHKLSGAIRKTIRIGAITITAATVLISSLIILPNEPGMYKDTLFGREPITLGTIIMSFIWFGGLLSLFQYLLPWMKRWLGWLLQTFGERSLTAYILHTIPLVLCQLLFIQYKNIWLNSLLAIGCILCTWALLKIPYINKVIPR
jgi:hypothetical protein